MTKIISTMLQRWKTLSYTSKFSILSCIIMSVVGFFTMGLVGLGLYFLVYPVLLGFPNVDTWHGDWVWPAMLLVSFLFPIGFIFGGLAWHYLKTKISSKIALRILYGLILWVWALILWCFTIFINLHNMD